MSPKAWRSTIMYLIALVIIASSFVDAGRWSDHWVFVTVYVIAFLWCVWRFYWIGALAAGAVTWLRIDLAEHVTGFQLKVSSALFAVLFFALCVAGAERKRDSV